MASSVTTARTRTDPLFLPSGTPEGRAFPPPFFRNILTWTGACTCCTILRGRLQNCIYSFAVIVSEGHDIDRQDFDFVVEFYVNGIIGLIPGGWIWECGCPRLSPRSAFCLRLLDNRVENMLERFQLD